MKSEFFGFLFFAAMIVNGLWYYIKYVVGQQGYKTSLFSGHFGDIANLHKVIGKEKNTYRKRNYQILLLGFYLSLFLVVASFLMMATNH